MENGTHSITPIRNTGPGNCQLFVRGGDAKAKRTGFVQVTGSLITQLPERPLADMIQLATM